MFQHLQPYLAEVKTVIIPELGAITITNPDTGETMFMSFLKHDDGKFAAYLAEKEGIDLDSAKAKLSAAVSEIQSTLNREGRAAIPGFGDFVMEGGEIDFVPQQEAKAEPAPPPVEEPTLEETVPEVSPEPSAPLPPVTVVEEPEAEKEEPEQAPQEEESKVVEVTPIAEEPAPTMEEPVSVPEIPQEQEPTMETPEAPIENAPAEEKEEVPVEIPPVAETPLEKETPIVPLHPDTEEATPEMNILQKEQLAASQKKLEDLRKAKDAKPAKRKRGAGFWMLMVLIALLAVGGTFVGIYYDEVKQHVPFLADAEEKEDTAQEEMEEMEELLDEGETEEGTEEDSIEENVEDTEEASPEPEPTAEVNNPPAPATTTSSSSAMPWHLIAGTFSVEANAQRLSDNLRKAGLSPTIRQVGAMYLVSAKGFPSKEAAMAGKAELNSIAPKAWLYEWN